MKKHSVAAAHQTLISSLKSPFVMKLKDDSGAEIVIAFVGKKKNTFAEASTMEIRDDYKFLRVEDAFKALHLNISLIGVIVELDFPTASGISNPSLPKPPSQTPQYIYSFVADDFNLFLDCSCTLKIIDPWHSGSGLPVKLIARANRSLPRVESIGDVIFLSSVKVAIHTLPFVCSC